MPDLPAVVWVRRWQGPTNYIVGCVDPKLSVVELHKTCVPALVLTPNVLTDLRNMDKTGICCNGYPWLRAALEAGNG